MTSQTSCQALWHKFNQLSNLKEVTKVALKKAETEEFKPGSLTSALSELKNSFADYHKEAARLVRLQLPDGRRIQQRDYLALRRFVDGCESTTYSKTELWAEIIKLKIAGANGMLLDEHGRVTELGLGDCGLKFVGPLKWINNLTKLELPYNYLTSIEIPKTLAELKVLNMHDNLLLEIEIPHFLTAVEKLSLYNNPNLINVALPSKCSAIVELASCPKLNEATKAEALKRKWRLR